MKPGLRFRWLHERWLAPSSMALLLLAAAVAIPYVAADFGSAWDDTVQQEYGRRALSFFMTRGEDQSANDLLDLKYYGPAIEMLIAAVTQLAPEKHVFLRHVVAAALALLAAPAMYWLGRLLGSRWIGVGATLLLILTPQFCGHAFVNTKDIPFAVGVTASLAMLTAMFVRGRFSAKEIFFTGLAIGLTLAIRPGGALILGAYYAALTAFTDWQTGRRDLVAIIPRGPSQRTLGKQFALLAIAWTVMVLPWPWALESPLEHPLQAIRMASKFHLVMPVLFEGKFYYSNDLPRHYLARFVLMTVPLATLILAAVGMIAGVIQFVKRPLSRRARVVVMLLVWPVLPLVLFAVLRPNAYDGMRHFLFLLPAVAIWAAYGCWVLMSRLREDSHGRDCRATLLVRWSFAAALTVVVISQAITLVQWHPYQATYYNVLAGTTGVERQFETDYWLLSYKEAMDWIRRQPLPDEESDRKLRVLVAANEQSLACAANFSDPRIELVGTLDAVQPGDLPTGFDYYIGTTRGGMAYNYPDAPAVYLIERPGFVLTAIRRAGTASDRASAVAAK